MQANMVVQSVEVQKTSIKIVPVKFLVICRAATTKSKPTTSLFWDGMTSDIEDLLIGFNLQHELSRLLIGAKLFRGLGLAMIFIRTVLLMV